MTIQPHPLLHPGEVNAGIWGAGERVEEAFGSAFFFGNDETTDMTDDGIGGLLGMLLWHIKSERKWVNGVLKIGKRNKRTGWIG